MKRSLLFLGLIALLAGALLTLALTPAGLMFGYQLLRKELPELQIESISGSLVGPIQLTGVHYQDQKITIKLDSIEVNWQWRALFKNVIHIENTSASGLGIQYSPSDTDDNDTAIVLGPYLPENLIIDQLILDNTDYRQGELNIKLTNSTLGINKGILELTTGIHYQQDATSENISSLLSVKLHQEMQNWQINQLNLTLPNNTPLKASGVIDYEGKLSLQADWQQFSWPLHEQPWPVTLGAGTVDLTGTLDRLQFALDTAFVSNTVSGELKTQGQLQGNQLELVTLAINTPNGNLNGSARLALENIPSWQIHIALSDINPEFVNTDWPGQLTGKVTLNGRYPPAGVAQEVQLHTLSGSLRGYPVTANGTFRHTGDHLNIRQLALQSGQTRVNIQGEVNQHWKTQWSIESPDLAQLWPDAKGELHASGKLSGPREHPVIETTFRGLKLKLADYEVQSILGEARIDTSTQGEWRATANAEQLVSGEQQLQHASLILQGRAQQHVLQLELQHQELQARLVAEGGLNNQQWQGRLQKAGWQSQQLGDWQLQSSIPNIVIDTRNVLLPKGCWQQSTALLCMDFKYTMESGWKIVFEGRELPLAFAQPWLPEPLIIKGFASVSGTLQADPGAALPEHGKLTLQLTPGSVRYGEQNDDVVEYQAGELALSLAEQTLSGKLGLQVNEYAELQGDLEILQLHSEEPQVTAQLRGTIDELGLLEPFFTQIDQLSGNLYADLSLNGSLYKPIVTGQLALSEGRLVIPQTAVAYQDIQLKVSSESKRRLVVTGFARSADEGELRVNGNLWLHEKEPWEIRLKLKGQQFLVSDTLENQIRVNPDLQLQIQPYTIRLSGDLEIPRARLKPKDYQGAITPSSDTEFAQQELQETRSRWKFFSLVTINLGEDVYFHGYGLQGFFTGRVTIQDEPGLLTRGTGELAIRDGLYRAYGQDLDIEIGRLLFNNSPIDSPAIHVRAARTVGTVKAGLQADGEIRSPSVSLYSDPAMSDSDTLSYLLFGRALNRSSESETASLAQAASAIGVSGGGLFAAQIGEELGLDEVSVEGGETLEETALLVGKYLSPSLYLGYSVGLFEPINTLLLRYRINENWMIETETGPESGGDILYTIER